MFAKTAGQRRPFPDAVVLLIMLASALGFISYISFFISVLFLELLFIKTDSFYFS